MVPESAIRKVPTTCSDISRAAQLYTLCIDPIFDVESLDDHPKEFSKPSLCMEYAVAPLNRAPVGTSPVNYFTKESGSDMKR